MPRANPAELDRKLTERRTKRTPRISDDAALYRIASAGLTVRQAQNLDDATLLRLPFIGRRTLFWIRASLHRENF